LILPEARALAEEHAQNLTPAGYETLLARDGQDGLTQAELRIPDLVVLDLMLPELDGLMVCQAMRSNPRTAAIPIIMVTARADEADRIAGLELGADDYVTKPFSPKELAARVSALLRRTQRSAPASLVLRYGPITIDADRHTVTVDGQDVRLTAKEFLLLQYLLEHRGSERTGALGISRVTGRQCVQHFANSSLRSVKFRCEIWPILLSLGEAEGL
jgi:DNA-binding response OmpR family regulator